MKQYIFFKILCLLLVIFPLPDLLGFGKWKEDKFCFDLVAQTVQKRIKTLKGSRELNREQELP